MDYWPKHWIASRVQGDQFIVPKYSIMRFCNLNSYRFLSKCCIIIFFMKILFFYCFDLFLLYYEYNLVNILFKLFLLLAGSHAVKSIKSLLSSGREFSKSGVNLNSKSERMHNFCSLTLHIFNKVAFYNLYILIFTSYFL